MAYFNPLKLILFIISLSFSILSHSHTSFPKTIKCPIDENEFTINITHNYTTFSSYLDFQKTGAIGDLYESMVNSCPKCHYSGYESDFDTTYSNNTKQDILKILEPYKRSEMTDVLENEITIKIYQYFKRDHNVIATLYLIASYFLREDSTQTQKRKELQINSATYFIKAIENNEYNSTDLYATIHYLIGELYRRTGDFSNALKHYNLAINDENKQEWVLEISEQQKALALKEDDNNSI